MSSRKWLQSLTTAAQHADGAGVASLLALVDRQSSQPNVYPDLRDVAGQAQYFLGDKAWGEMMFEYLQAIQYLTNANWAESYRHAATAFIKLLPIFKENEQMTWLMPLVHQTVFDLRVVSTLADDEDRTGAMKNLRDCSDMLSKGFAACWNDRTDPRLPESKRRGVVYIVNNCLKVYFKLGNLRLCKNMIKPLELSMGNRPPFIEMDFIPRSELVTYKYYVGRLNVLEDKYAEALECLEYALAHCHPSAHSNKRRILTFLIPIKLCKGALPSDRLIQMYRFNELADLVKAVRVGDLHTFNQALDQFQELFIKQGTYLVLERVRALVFRTLIKNIEKLEEKPEEKSAKPRCVSLRKVESVLSAFGEPMSLDEIECVVANLIFKSMIRGYISHSRRILVLSKEDPFPFSAVKKGAF